MGTSIDWDRRNAAELCLADWLKIYLPQIFHLPWTPQQLDWCASLHSMLSDINQRITVSPCLHRAQGNTSIIIGTSLFAALTGRRRFQAFMHDKLNLAVTHIDGMEYEIGESKSLAEDYPVALNRRRLSRTRLVIPYSRGSARHQVLIKAIHLDRGLRGEVWHPSENSGSVRPDWLVFDY